MNESTDQESLNSLIRNTNDQSFSITHNDIDHNNELKQIDFSHFHEDDHNTPNASEFQALTEDQYARLQELKERGFNELSEDEKNESATLMAIMTTREEEIRQHNNPSYVNNSSGFNNESSSSGYGTRGNQISRTRDRTPRNFEKILQNKVLTTLTGDATSLPKWLAEVDGLLYSLGLLALTLLNKWTNSSYENRQATVTRLRLTSQYKTLVKTIKNGTLPKVQPLYSENQTALELHYLSVMDTCPNLEELLFTVLKASISIELHYLLPEVTETEIIRTAYFDMVKFHINGNMGALLEREAQLYSSENNTMTTLRSLDEDPLKLVQRLLTEMKLINLIAGKRGGVKYIGFERLSMILRRGIIPYDQYRQVFLILEKDNDDTNFQKVAKALHLHYLEYVKPKRRQVPSTNVYQATSDTRDTQVIKSQDNLDNSPPTQQANSANTLRDEKRDNHDKKGRQLGLCWNYLENKTCKFGDKCKFEHRDSDKVVAHLTRNLRDHSPSFPFDDESSGTEWSPSSSYGESSSNRRPTRSEMRAYKAGYTQPSKAEIKAYKAGLSERFHKPRSKRNDDKTSHRLRTKDESARPKGSENGSRPASYQRTLKNFHKNEAQDIVHAKQAQNSCEAEYLAMSKAIARAGELQKYSSDEYYSSSD